MSRVESGSLVAAVGLFKIGFENFDGDQSDARASLSHYQSAGNYSADQYFYHAIKKNKDRISSCGLPC